MQPSSGILRVSFTTDEQIIDVGRQLLYNIPFLFLFSHLWGLNGLLHAQMAADYCTVITAILIGIPLLCSLHKQSKQQVDNLEGGNFHE